MNPASRISYATGVIREAGAHALSFYRRLDALTTERKGAQDVVSEADRDVETLIRGALHKQFPDDAVLGEEGGRFAGNSGMLWVVDPIDGTQCFLDNIPCWCVSIGLVYRDQIVGGLIYDPLHDELFIADSEQATCNGRVMRPSEASDFSLGMVEVGWSTRVPAAATLDFIAALLDAGGIYHRGGSGALALAYVADARYLAYFEAHMQIWDSCAGAALVARAGGWINDILANEGISAGSRVMACGASLTGAYEVVARAAGHWQE